MSLPRVTLKVAATLDGKISTKLGHSQWITGTTSRQKVHQLRHQHDAILVGIGTVIADNPQLTTRGIPEGKSPIRVILDSQLRLSPQSACLALDGVTCFVCVGRSVSSKKIESFQNSTIKILQASTDRPEPQWTLEQLSYYGIASVLIEGGSQIYTAFLQAKMVDHLALFLGGMLMGEEALSWCGHLGVSLLTDAPQCKITQVELLGSDLFIFADFLKN